MVSSRESSHQNIIRPEGRGCGLSTNSLRKSGGTKVDPNEWPWMVALIRRNLPFIFCGGVLITDRHVLSAAHCTYKYNKHEIIVRLGEYNFENINETRIRDIGVFEIHQHLNFDENTYNNDIVLLKLIQPVLFNSYVWPVCMPPNEETIEENVGVVIGWGSKFFGGPNSDVLMEVSIPIWKNSDCQNVFVERIKKNVLCAGAIEGGHDSCQVGNHRNNKLIQVNLCVLLSNC